MTDESMKYIRQYLNLTLEELSLVCSSDGRNHSISFTGLLELKSMTKLKVLNLNIYNKGDYGEKIQSLTQHLTHVKISGNSCCDSWCSLLEA